MSISQRTAKLILATCLACLLAYFLNLSSAVSAGIIALLSLSDTRRSTLKLVAFFKMTFICFKAAHTECTAQSKHAAISRKKASG